MRNSADIHAIQEPTELRAGVNNIFMIVPTTAPIKDNINSALSSLRGMSICIIIIWLYPMTNNSGNSRRNSMPDFSNPVPEII